MKALTAVRVKSAHGTAVFHDSQGINIICLARWTQQTGCLWCWVCWRVSESQNTASWKRSQRWSSPTLDPNWRVNTKPCFLGKPSCAFLHLLFIRSSKHWITSWGKKTSHHSNFQISSWKTTPRSPQTEGWLKNTQNPEKHRILTETLLAAFKEPQTTQHTHTTV